MAVRACGGGLHLPPALPSCSPKLPSVVPTPTPAQDFMFLPFDPPPCTPPIPPRLASLCPRGPLLLRLGWRNEEEEEGKKAERGENRSPAATKTVSQDRQKVRQTGRKSSSQSVNQTDRYSTVAEMIQLYRRCTMGRSFSTSPQQRRYYVALILSTPSLPRPPSSSSSSRCSLPTSM